MPKFYWTDDRCRRAKEMWFSGVSSKQIAIALGCPEKSFRNYVARVKLHRFTMPQPHMSHRCDQPGLTRDAVAYMQGMECAFASVGQIDKAAEVQSDMAEMQRLAMRLNLIFARSA